MEKSRLYKIYNYSYKKLIIFPFTTRIENLDFRESFSFSEGILKDLSSIIAQHVEEFEFLIT